MAETTVAELQRALDDALRRKDLWHQRSVRLEQEHARAAVHSCGNHDHGGHGCHNRPHISIDPAVYSGQPCITWRIPPEIPCQQWWFGTETVDGITENWPSVTLPRFLVAAWYLGTYGSRVWRKRWGAWAAEVSGLMWHADQYDQIPLPPQQEAP